MGIQFEFWSGVRRTDEGTSAAGYYCQVLKPDGQVEVEFRPLMTGLSHEEAELVAHLFRAERSPELDRLRQMADGIQNMTGAKRNSFFADLRSLDLEMPRYERGAAGHSHDLDISF